MLLYNYVKYHWLLTAINYYSSSRWWMLLGPGSMIFHPVAGAGGLAEVASQRSRDGLWPGALLLMV